MQTKMYKTPTGHDIITEYEEKDGKLIWHFPFAVVPIPQSGNIGVIPLIPYAGGNLEVNKDHIFLEYESDKDILEMYKDQAQKMRAHKAGIAILPDNKKIIT